MDSAALSDVGSPWWEEKTKTKALHPAQAIFKYFADQDKHRLAAYIAYARIYTNRRIHANDFLGNYTAAFSIEGNAYSRVPINLCKVYVDAVHSRVTRQNPRPVFVTSGGNFTLQKKARQMQKWVEYCDQYTDLRDTKKRAELDSLIFGNGFVKTSLHPAIDDICNERIYPGDLFVDPVEAAASGKPNHMYQRALVSRSRLMKLYPKHADKIKRAGRITEEEYSNRKRATLQNMTEVVEGWRLPSWRGAGDGKHIIWVDGQVLELGEYKCDDFPITKTQWKEDPTVGYWGISLVEELLGVHFDFNNSIKNIETCIENMPTPFILIPEGGNVSEGSLGNVNGVVINYSDRAPTFELPPSVPADVVNYAQAQWDKGAIIARLTSVSMPETTGNGFETGAAVRDFNDIQSTELAPQYEEYEQFNVRLYAAQVRCGKELSIRNPGYSVVMAKDKYTIEEIEWTTIAPPEDQKKDSFIIQGFPANKLSQSPAGKKSDVLDFFNAGWLDSGQAMDLLDFPDMEQFQNLQNAARRNVERLLEEILDEGIYTPPEPTLDLRLSLKMTQMYINRAQAMSVPEERVALLRKFMRQIHALLQESEAATRVAQGGMGLPAAGGPPAVSPDGSMPTAI
jgi:hypothetical protein